MKRNFVVLLVLSLFLFIETIAISALEKKAFIPVNATITINCKSRLPPVIVSTLNYSS